MKEPMRVRVETTKNNTPYPLGWSLKVTNVETGQTLPVSATDPIEIVISDFDEPIKVRLTLLISEMDVEAIL